MIMVNITNAIGFAKQTNTLSSQCLKENLKKKEKNVSK